MDQGKKRRWLHVPSPAMIVACVALFVAMGGTSYAAVTLAANSVGTKQLKNSAVTTAKIKNGAVGTTKIGKVPGARVRRTAAVSIPSGRRQHRRVLRRRRLQRPRSVQRQQADQA